MDLVERYIAAVKFWLPARLRDDIAAELAEDIRSQIEEIERDKGRKLNEDEVADLLKARGTPLSVASRYQPQRTLIGPELFPLYIFVLKIVAAICIIPALLSWTGVAILHPDRFSPQWLPIPFDSLLTSFAIVTLIFAAIEHNGVNPAKSRNWNPKTLRPVIDRGRIKRSTSVGDIIGSLILLAFFAAGYLSRTSYQMAGGILVVSPEWIPYWQILVGLAVAEIGLSAFNLFQPYWSVPRILLWMSINLAKTAAFCWLLASHVLRELVIYGMPAKAIGQAYAVSDIGALYAVPFGVVASLIIVATAAWRLIRTLPKAVVA